jgi:hypothetical protein
VPKQYGVGSKQKTFKQEGKTFFKHCYLEKKSEKNTRKINYA